MFEVGFGEENWLFYKKMKVLLLPWLEPLYLFPDAGISPVSHSPFQEGEMEREHWLPDSSLISKPCGEPSITAGTL